MIATLTKSIHRSGTHVVSVYATGLNNRDNNVREEMTLLTLWGRDKMTTICISFPNTIFKWPEKPIAICSKAWHGEDTRPLPESVVIPAKVYESLGLIELITSRILYWENISMRIKTVLFENTRDTFTQIAESGQFRPLQVGSGRGTGRPYFVKSPMGHFATHTQSFAHLKLIFLVGGFQPYTTRLVRRPAIYTATRSQAFGSGVAVGLIMRIETLLVLVRHHIFIKNLVESRSGLLRIEMYRGFKRLFNPTDTSFAHL